MQIVLLTRQPVVISVKIIPRGLPRPRPCDRPSPRPSPSAPTRRWALSQDGAKRRRAIAASRRQLMRGGCGDAPQRLVFGHDPRGGSRLRLAVIVDIECRRARALPMGDAHRSHSSRSTSCGTARLRRRQPARITKQVVADHCTTARAQATAILRTARPALDALADDLVATRWSTVERLDEILTQAGFTPASAARAGSAAIAANAPVVPEPPPAAKKGSGPSGAAGP